MEVKKLMANRIFLGESLGKSPANQSAQVGSSSLEFNSFSPIISASSWNSILIKIREDDVVSSSVSLIIPKIAHGKASDARR